MRYKKFWSSMVMAGASAWAVVVCVGFIVEQPFSPYLLFRTFIPRQLVFPPLVVWFDYAYGFGMAVVLFLSALSAGHVVFLGRRFIFKDLLERFVIQVVIGYMMLSFFMLGLGVLGLYYRPLLVGMTVLLALWPIFQLRHAHTRESFRNLTLEIKHSLFPSQGGSLFGWILIGVMMIHFVMAFVPELFYDALVYHLGVPNLYLLEGRIISLDLLQSKFPFAIQMIWTLGLALKDEMVTKLTHVIFLSLTLIGVCVLCRRLEKPRAGILASVLLCTLPMVQMQVWTSGIDLAVCLMAVLSVLCHLNSITDSSEKDGWFFLSAVFAGFCVSSKYTSIAIPLASCSVGVLMGLINRQMSARKILFRYFQYVGVMGVVVSPWLIKNWIDAGNPVYPFLSAVFGGNGLDAERLSMLRAENKGAPLSGSLDLLNLPWVLSIKDRTSLSFLGPFFLAFIPFLFFSTQWFKQKKLMWVLLWCVSFVLFGFCMTRLTRYLLPGLMVLGVLWAIVIEEVLEKRSPYFRWFTLSVVAFIIYLHLSMGAKIIGAWIKPSSVLLGLEPRAEFSGRFHHMMNPYPAQPIYPKVEQWCGDSKRVLIIGDEKVYPLKARYVYSGVYDRNLLFQLSEKHARPEDIIRELHERGIRSVLVNSREGLRTAHYGIYQMSENAFGLFCAIWQRYFRLEHIEEIDRKNGEKNTLVLFEIMPDPKALPHPDVHNFLADFYEQVEMPRMGITTTAQKLEFFKRQTQKWPDIEHLSARLHDISEK